MLRLRSPENVANGGRRSEQAGQGGQCREEGPARSRSSRRLRFARQRNSVLSVRERERLRDLVEVGHVATVNERVQCVKRVAVAGLTDGLRVARNAHEIRLLQRLNSRDRVSVRLQGGGWVGERRDHLGRVERNRRFGRNQVGHLNHIELVFLNPSLVLLTVISGSLGT